MDNAELAARYLIAYSCNCEWQDIFTKPQQLIDELQQSQIQTYIKRLIDGESIWRIIGERSFYGYDFKLSAATLEPRPDTESLIELIQPYISQYQLLHGLDIGTGSGIIAITLCLLNPQLQMQAVDIQRAALATAQLNATALQVADRIEFIESDLYSKINRKFDFIVSNPPYIKSAEIQQLDKNVREFDPLIALDGGADGLEFYRQLATLSSHFLTEKGLIALEIGHDQFQAVKDIFSQHGWHYLAAQKDLNGINRSVLWQR